MLDFQGVSTPSSSSLRSEAGRLFREYKQVHPRLTPTHLATIGTFFVITLISFLKAYHEQDLPAWLILPFALFILSATLLPIQLSRFNQEKKALRPLETPSLLTLVLEQITANNFDYASTLFTSIKTDSPKIWAKIITILMSRKEASSPQQASCLDILIGMAQDSNAKTTKMPGASGLAAVFAVFDDDLPAAKRAIEGINSITVARASLEMIRTAQKKAKNSSQRNNLMEVEKRCLSKLASLMNTFVIQTSLDSENNSSLDKLFQGVSFSLILFGYLSPNGGALMPKPTKPLVPQEKQRDLLDALQGIIEKANEVLGSNQNIQGLLSSAVLGIDLDRIVGEVSASLPRLLFPRTRAADLIELAAELSEANPD